MESEKAFLFGNTNILYTYFWQGIHNGRDNSQEPEIMDGSNLLVFSSRIPTCAAINSIWRERASPTIRYWEKRVNSLSSMVVDVRVRSRILYFSSLDS